MASRLVAELGCVTCLHPNEVKGPFSATTPATATSKPRWQSAMPSPNGRRSERCNAKHWFFLTSCHAELIFGIADNANLWRQVSKGPPQLRHKSRTKVFSVCHSGMPKPSNCCSVSSGDIISIDRPWQKFDEPTECWDNQANKLHQKFGDSKHKSTKVNSSSTQRWVPDAVERETAKDNGGGSIASLTVAYGEQKAGNVVERGSGQGDESSWAAQISRYVKCGQGREALRIYKEMCNTGLFIPSSRTFVAALKACRSLRDLESAKQIHANVVETGFESDIYVGNVLVDVYAKCGSLVDARQVFEGMPHRNVVSWTAMILGYCEMGEGDIALHLYARMQQEGVTPNDRTFVVALKACRSLKTAKDSIEHDDNCMKTWCLRQVRTIHADILRIGFERDVFVGNMLVDVYAKCGNLVEARQVFEKMPHRDVVSWNAMISGYALMEAGEEALQLYTRMQQEGVVPDDRTFVAVLKACSTLATMEEVIKADSKCGDRECLELVRAIHSKIVKTGSDSTVFVGTMLVDVYAKCGSLVDARHVFERMPHRNVVSWTAMILGYAQIDEGEVALDLYARMKHEGIVPDSRAFIGALKACSSLASLEQCKAGGERVKKRCLQQVRDIHTEIQKNGCESDAFVANILVVAYAKCGSLGDARSVFEKMPHRTVVSWTTMILAYIQNEEGEVALQLYAQMQHEGVVPDARTFVAAIMACGEVAGLEKGKEIHAQISRIGLEATDPFVLSALIDMYSKCGSMADAQQVFDLWPTKNIVTWNALIAGYARQGESETVFRLFERLKQQGIHPTGITSLTVLTACSHMGLVDKGQQYFDAMSRDHGITPTIEHYSCMVDLLGRAGQLDKAIEMAEALESNGVVWKTVLGACLKWRNVALGRRAFESAVKLDRTDAAIYVLMSNLYAAAHLWQEQHEIQALRVKAGAWQQSGQSWWTDLGGTRYAFPVGDRTS